MAYTYTTWFEKKAYR